MSVTSPRAGRRHAPITGSVQHHFDVLPAKTVAFLATRHDLQQPGAINYLSPARPPPRGVRLQDDFADWLRRGPCST
jgi:hypothetical protein